MNKRDNDSIDLFVIVLLFIVLMMAVLSGCATTDYDRECQRAVDLENWTLCEQVYKEAREYTLHRDHQHPSNAKVKWWHIKSDLNDNQCRRVLGDYYAEC